jgi:hypothetical protein
MLREIYDLNYSKMGNPDFIIHLGGIGDALKLHSAYLNLPEEVPKPARFHDLAARLTVAVKAAQYGDSQKKAELDAIRLEAEEASAALAHWALIRFLATKEQSVLANLGLIPKKPVVKNQNQASETAPQNVRVKHGKISGTAILSSGRVTGSASLEVHICQGDPMSEESWKLYDHFPHCSHMELKGLEIGKMYYFRIRCLGNNGHGPWSAIVNLMVI